MSTVSEPSIPRSIQVSGRRPIQPWKLSAPPNVASWERFVSLLAGGALVGLGIRQGSWKGLGLALAGGASIYRGVAGHCHLYDVLGINTAGFSNPAFGVRAGHGCKFERSLTINREPEEVYQFWRRLSNLPKIMRHVISITEEDGGRSHWVADGPLGTSVSWDAEIIHDEPGALIAWRSLPGSIIDSEGSVHFAPAPGNRGTNVKVSLRYEPIGGRGGALLAKLTGAGFEQQATEDLHCLKRYLESGEIPSVAGQPQGTSLPCQGA